MSGSSQTTQTNQTVAPWGPQADDLNRLSSMANQAADQASTVPAYSGDFVSQVGAQGAQNNANLSSSMDRTINSAAILQGAGGDTLSGGLANSYRALNGLQNYGEQSASGMAGQTAAAAQQYMNPGIVNGQVQAAMRSADQNFTENVLPSINVGAAMSNNGLSSRNGIAQGIAERGLNQQAVDAAANLNANAYNQGINAVQAGNQQKLSAMSNAGSLSGNLASQGAYDMSSGVNATATNANTVGTLNQQQIGYAQNALTNALDKTNYAVSQPYQNADLYNGIVNSRNWGSQTTGTSTTENNPSLMSTIGSGLGAVGGIMGKCDSALKIVEALWGYGLDGTPAYLFRYRNDNERRIYLGPMADEIAVDHPELIQDINGVRHIRMHDYVEYYKGL